MPLVGMVLTTFLYIVSVESQKVGSGTLTEQTEQMHKRRWHPRQSKRTMEVTSSGVASVVDLSPPHDSAQLPLLSVAEISSEGLVSSARQEITDQADRPLETASIPGAAPPRMTPSHPSPVVLHQAKEPATAIRSAADTPSEKIVSPLEKESLQSRQFPVMRPAEKELQKTSAAPILSATLDVAAEPGASRPASLAAGIAKKPTSTEVVVFYVVIAVVIVVAMILSGAIVAVNLFIHNSLDSEDRRDSEVQEDSAVQSSIISSDMSDRDTMPIMAGTFPRAASEVPMRRTMA